MYSLSGLADCCSCIKPPCRSSVLIGAVEAAHENVSQLFWWWQRWQTWTWSKGADAAEYLLDSTSFAVKNGVSSQTAEERQKIMLRCVGVQQGHPILQVFLQYGLQQGSMQVRPRVCSTPTLLSHTAKKQPPISKLLLQAAIVLQCTHSLALHTGCTWAPGLEVWGSKRRGPK